MSGSARGPVRPHSPRPTAANGADGAAATEGQDIESACEHYRDLFHNAPVGYFVLDGRGRITDVNLTASQMLKSERDDVMHNRFAALIRPEDAGLFGRCRESALSTGLEHGCEVRIMRQGGWFYAQLEMATDAAGGLRVVIIDVNSRKEAQEQLRKSEEFTRTLLEGITDGFMAFDRRWRVVYINGTAARLLGKTPEQCLGRVAWGLFPVSSRQRFQEEFRRAMSERTPGHLEQYYPAPLDRWHECHCYPRADGLTCFFRDITDRKKDDNTGSSNREHGPGPATAGHRTTSAPHNTNPQARGSP